MAVLGVLMIAASIFYRKYRRVMLREKQAKVQQEQRRRIIEFTRKQDSIAFRKREDSINEVYRVASQKKLDALHEKRKQLQETMKILEKEEAAKKAASN